MPSEINIYLHRRRGSFRRSSIASWWAPEHSIRLFSLCKCRARFSARNWVNWKCQRRNLLHSSTMQFPRPPRYTLLHCVHRFAHVSMHSFLEQPFRDRNSSRAVPVNHFSVHVVLIFYYWSATTLSIHQLKSPSVALLASNTYTKWRPAVFQHRCSDSLIRR